MVSDPYAYTLAPIEGDVNVAPEIVPPDTTELTNARFVSEPALLVVKFGLATNGAVSVLFVRVSVPDKVASVPVVGRVTLVIPASVRVIGPLEDVVNAPARVGPVIALSAVPPELTATHFDPFPDKTGSLAKAVSIAANSARTIADEPEEAKEGLPLCEYQSAIVMSPYHR